MTLRRVIVEFREDGIQLRTLYRTQTSANPGTVRRRREVVDLAKSGLAAALEALDNGKTEDLGTSGFTTREDTLGLPTASRTSTTQVKKGEK